MQYAKPYYISPAFAFLSYPNRDSTPFKEFYNIPEAETVIRGTLRYQGFPEFIKALVQLGWLDASEKEWLKEGLTWAQVSQNALGTNDANEGYFSFLCCFSFLADPSYALSFFFFDSTLIIRIKQICNFPSVSESERIISGLRWIGLFSSEPVKPRAGNLLDTLCAQLETLMKYDQGERDLVMLQHKFVVEWADGTEV